MKNQESIFKYKRGGSGGVSHQKVYTIVTVVIYSTKSLFPI